MANIELRERLSGGGFRGTIDMPPALSWNDHQALQQSAAGAMASAVELRALNARVASLGAAVVGLEAELCLRLDAQTDVLASQLNVLARIEHALRRPGQVRAAERIANTAELLRRGRYERALSDAELAIADDPINPAGFVAAGWAAVGLGRGEAARGFFLEAGEASDADDRATALRQAARITFALEDGTAALSVLAACDDQTSAFQELAVDYDRAVYLAASDDQAGAIEALRPVLAADERFAPMVFADAVLNQDPVLRDMAATAIRESTEALASEHDALGRDLEAVEEALDAYEGPAPVAWIEGRERMRQEMTELRDARGDATIAASRGDRLSMLKTLRRRAATLREEAERWPVAARNAHDEECAEAARREEQERAAAMAMQIAEQLENDARRFAAQKAAIPKKKPDGSWIITKEKRFGGNEAWRAQVVNGTSSIEHIPWASRHKWD